MSRTLHPMFVAALFAATGDVLQAQPTAEDMNKSNNPLTPSIGLNLQDQYVGRSYGLDDKDSNALLLRGTVPHKLFGLPQILRATMPVVTTADLPPAGRHTGAGDLNLFDLFLFKQGHVELGLGPQLTLPTASRDEMGTGKWQAGLAGVVIAPQPWGMTGGLVTWQHSFAGDDDRPTTNSLQVQPFFIYNLPQGLYLRSTATMSFNLRNGDYAVPLGLGAGKVWKSGNTTLNLFAEPQWTVAHEGDGQPKFQLFFGLNLQFPL
ncbi:hypothetical protein GCM10027034_00950 [Ramlibacter solisilvae]|uniref:Transporter n=1 Tax=Ramlibacter tataouinensis TaxID=94132 RepID=A0A127JP25_9BURK|nr:hypothetical protein [Ramlibacter tataouinensis]AMO21784.1 hypothetical protein UC35_01450 [Ramlibacter tataouinensis]